MGPDGTGRFRGGGDWIPDDREGEPVTPVDLSTSTAGYATAADCGHRAATLDGLARALAGHQVSFKMVHDMEPKPSRGDSGYDDVVRRRHGKMSDIGNSHGNEWDVAAKDALKPLGYHDHGNSPDAWEGIACGPNHYEFQNLEAAKRYRKTGNTSQAVRCAEYSFIPFSADRNFKSNEFKFEGEKVMVFRKQNGKYVSLSDDEVESCRVMEG